MLACTSRLQATAAGHVISSLKRLATARFFGFLFQMRAGGTRRFPVRRCPAWLVAFLLLAAKQAVAARAPVLGLRGADEESEGGGAASFSR